MKKESFLLNLNNEWKSFTGILKSLNRKVVIVFLSIAILQTVSWYFTSRRFFRAEIFESFQFEPDIFLWEYLYWFAGDFITLFLIPVLIIKFLFKENIKDYGLAAGDYKTGLKFSALFLSVMIIIVWFASAYPAFSETYPLLQSAKGSSRVFIMFEAGLIVYIFAWEFIWRGFMLFGLKQEFGYYAVFIQMIPFLISHNGKPVLETSGAIIGGVLLGFLALRTNSVFYCVIIHAGVMFAIDFISTLRYTAQDYGTGLSSLLNILKQIF